MKTISVCMIVKDEEDVLARILSDASKFADEIIVVDTGSTDKTKEIAARFTDKVYDFVWRDDFSAARNASFSHATCDYLMWLDADDRVPERSCDALNLLKAKLTTEDVVMMPYETAFDAHGATFRYFRERLLRREGNFLWLDPVHEAIAPHGNIIYREIPVEHRKVKAGNPARNLEIYENLLARNVLFSPRQKFYYANELVRNDKPDAAKTAYADFLATTGGMAENRAAARLSLSRLNADNTKTAAEILLKGLYEGMPSAETLVDLGHIFVREERFRDAIPWYLAAMQATIPSPFAFRNVDMEKYLPCLQLALCFYKLGDKRSALFYNAEALAAKPDGELALRNQRFYEEMP